MRRRRDEVLEIGRMRRDIRRDGFEGGFLTARPADAVPLAFALASHYFANAA